MASDNIIMLNDANLSKKKSADRPLVSPVKIPSHQVTEVAPLESIGKQDICSALQ